MRQIESGITQAAASVTPGPLERLMSNRMMVVRVFRFGVSGGFATGVHVAIATTLINGFSATQVQANGVAFICANVCSYLLNALWSFSAKPGRANFLRFYLVSLLGLALTLVRVRASSSSTQLNMKQKNAATPTPALISGRKMVRKNRGKV